MFWRSLLIRILVNFAAITIALILPGFNIVDPWLGSPVLDLLAAALVLALLNAFVKPVLQILTGRLTIATLGLFGFVIDAMVLWLLVCALAPTLGSAAWLHHLADRGRADCDSLDHL